MDLEKRERDKRVMREQAARKHQRMREAVEASRMLEAMKAKEDEWRNKQIAFQSLGVDAMETHPVFWTDTANADSQRWLPAGARHPACRPLAPQPTLRFGIQAVARIASARAKSSLPRRGEPPAVSLSATQTRCPICRAGGDRTVRGCPACWRNPNDLPWTQNRNSSYRKRRPLVEATRAEAAQAASVGQTEAEALAAFRAARQRRRRSATDSRRALSDHANALEPAPPRAVTIEGCSPGSAGLMINRVMVERFRFDRCSYLTVYTKRCPAGDVTKLKLLQTSPVRYLYFLLQSNSAVDSNVSELGVETVLLLPTERGLFVIERDISLGTPMSNPHVPGLRTLMDYNIKKRNTEINLLEVAGLQVRSTPVVLRKFMSVNFAVNSLSFSTDLRWYLEDLPADLPGHDAVQKEMSSIIDDIMRLKVALMQGLELEERQKRRQHLIEKANKFRAMRLRDKRRLEIMRRCSPQDVEGAADRIPRLSVSTIDNTGDIRIGGGIPLSKTRAQSTEGRGPVAVPMAYLRQRKEWEKETSKADHRFEDLLHIPDDTAEWRVYAIKRIFRKLRDDYVTIFQSKITKARMKEMIRRAKESKVKIRQPKFLIAEQNFRLEAALAIAIAEGMALPEGDGGEDDSSTSMPAKGAWQKYTFEEKPRRRGGVSNVAPTAAENMVPHSQVTLSEALTHQEGT